ncbi:hypothetical protein GGS26DRAFT_298185 [Hypomontagnella submonticulosa]|nr:hypothetical protein GGS26DRAFT_298185 [Hypomontagnella submonticulosa]
MVTHAFNGKEGDSPKPPVPANFGPSTIRNMAMRPVPDSPFQSSQDTQNNKNEGERMGVDFILNTTVPKPSDAILSPETRPIDTITDHEKIAPHPGAPCRLQSSYQTPRSPRHAHRSQLFDSLPIHTRGYFTPSRTPPLPVPERRGQANAELWTDLPSVPGNEWKTEIAEVRRLLEKQATNHTLLALRTENINGRVLRLEKKAAELEKRVNGLWGPWIELPADDVRKLTSKVRELSDRLAGVGWEEDLLEDEYGQQGGQERVQQQCSDALKVAETFEEMLQDHDRTVNSRPRRMMRKRPSVSDVILM